MTSNQLAYQNNLETRRHNLASEDLQYRVLSETNRHNLVYEAETMRHNKAGEQETIRHNEETEAAQFYSINESKRHSQAVEAETNRHNLRTEAQEDRRQSEVERHALVTERQTDTQLAETERHNRADESIRGYANQISALNAQTNARLADNDVLKAYAAQLSAQGTIMRGEAALQQVGVSQQLADNASAQVPSLIDLNYARAETERLRGENIGEETLNMQKRLENERLKAQSMAGSTIIQGASNLLNILMKAR